jgi:hypothetical protein
MPKAGFIVARVSFLVLAASMLGVAMLAAPAAGQTSTCSTTSSKCFFAVSVSPQNATAGASTSFTFTIRNEASPQQLGSVQISVPAGFMITSASGATSFTSSSALFLNLSLASGSQTMLTVSATVPCGSGSYQWGIAAKQSNNFNGSGNDFQLDTQKSGSLSGTFTGSCTVAPPCPPSAPCSASASSATTTGTVTTSAPLPAGDSIVTGMEDVNTNPNSSFNYSCPTYTAVADVFGFAVFNAAGVPQPILLTVTIRIDKSRVSSSGHPGASSWQICYASTTPFSAVPGTSQQNVTIGGNPGYFTGLLPDCSSSQGAPCVQARNKNNAGDVIVTFLAFGDPYGHG